MAQSKRVQVGLLTIVKYWLSGASYTSLEGIAPALRYFLDFPCFCGIDFVAIVLLHSL